MAIECNACGQPVHETSVECPHCGEATGVPPDPIAQAEITLMPALDRPPQVIATPSFEEPPLFDAFVGRIIELARGEPESDSSRPAKLPRAVARVRRSGPERGTREGATRRTRAK